MFCVGNVYLSDDVALARFACNLTACGGQCCVRGDAGAPVVQTEVPALNKAWKLLKDSLRDRAREVVDKKGLLKGSGNNLELACTDGAECVFVEYDAAGTALCSIHKAFYEGRISWQKPLSCHLYPLRIIESGQFDYVNFEYIPEMCSPACDHAKSNNIFLAEYLEEPLVRKYGPQWYREFLGACRKIRYETEVLK
jgi:hypothetical protein